MNGFLIAAAIVGWFAIACALTVWAMEYESIIGWVCLAAWTVLGIGLVINEAQAEDEKGPCLREETGYTYNAATKTTMPYTYCAERGEWENQ